MSRPEMMGLTARCSSTHTTAREWLSFAGQPADLAKPAEAASYLLDGGGLLETVGVDASEELFLEVHGVEGLGDLVPVGLDLSGGVEVLLLPVHGGKGQG